MLQSIDKSVSNAAVSHRRHYFLRSSIPSTVPRITARSVIYVSSVRPLPYTVAMQSLSLIDILPLSYSSILSQSDSATSLPQTSVICDEGSVMPVIRSIKLLMRLDFFMPSPTYEFIMTQTNIFYPYTNRRDNADKKLYALIR